MRFTSSVSSSGRLGTSCAPTLDAIAPTTDEGLAIEANPTKQSGTASTSPRAVATCSAVCVSADAAGSRDRLNHPMLAHQCANLSQLHLSANEACQRKRKVCHCGLGPRAYRNRCLASTPGEGWLGGGRLERLALIVAEG